jgi:hypothetical protein
MAEDRPDHFQRRAREAGPLAPGCYRAVATDEPGVHDFTDLESAQRYANDVASEGDYEYVPPTAYIYDSRFERVDEGMHYAMRGHAGKAEPPSRGVMARLWSRWRRLISGA